MLQRRQHGRDGGVTESAERLAADVRRDTRQQIEIAHLAFAALDLAQNLVQPVRAFAARRALSAGFVTVEMQQVFGKPDHARRVVEHDDGGRAEERAGLLDGVETGLRVELIGHQDRHRRSAGDDGLQRSPLADATRKAFDQLPERDVHRRFIHARAPHVSADAVQLRSAVLLGSECGVPLGAAAHDERDVAERLDVVHGGRFAVEARRPQETAVCCVAARAFLRATRAARFPRRPRRRRRRGARRRRNRTPSRGCSSRGIRLVGLLDGGLQDALHVEEFAAYVDVGDLRADRVAANRASLDQQVGIALHQQMVLERARFALVRVARDVARFDLLVDELPFHARRKTRATAATQTGRLDLLDDRVRRLGQRFPERGVSVVLEIEVQREGVRLADVFDEDGVHA